MNKNIGRNDPCYCGSGKKYKKCCMQFEKDGIAPTWHPISEVPAITQIIEGLLNDSQNQYEIFTTASCTPTALDGATVKRATKLFKERQTHIDLYEEQIRRWKNENSAEAQLINFSALDEMILKLHKLNTRILELLKEIKEMSIDAIMNMSDAELGEMVMSGKIRPPHTEGAWTENQEKLAIGIHNQFQKLYKQNPSDEYILAGMYGKHMNNFHALMTGLTHADMSALSIKYSGLFCYAKLLEQLAQEIQSNKVNI